MEDDAAKSPTGEKRPDAPLVTVQRAPDAARRRSAPLAEETSDVTRFRGVWIAAALGALACVVALIATGGPGILRSPGPIGRPHQLAKLECDSCHKNNAPAVSACPSCHGSHGSTRPAHAALRKKGELKCSSCHAIHRSEEGVAFLPTGEVVRFGTGWESSVDSLSAFRPTKATTVPLVRAGACAGCHDLGSAKDPLAACLISGQESYAVDRPTVCFDEHRDVTTITGAGAKVAPGASTERDAAWEAARAEAALRPRVGGARGGLSRPLSWLGAGLFTALAALVVERTVRRRSRRTPAKVEAPVLQASSVVRLPQIDPTTCLGCYACVDACPYDVLEVRRYVAVVARPDDCCGLTLCEQRCPNGSLVVREGEPIDDRPRVSNTLESLDVPGLYLAGDLTGLPLIRNAINQGAHAARAAASGISKDRRAKSGDRYDLVIVGAGPAGISAALEAKAQGLSAISIEQGSVAESIRSFPRGKLVFDQPLGMPIAGDLWLEESTKEELLAKWLRIVRRERLQVLEGVRVTAIERHNSCFVVRGSSADAEQTVLETERVLLAIGRRGSPRKLAAPIADGAEGSVFYSLADARSFAGQRVVVVGLGDTAMETAIALAHQPGTDVTISYRGSGFRRGKARNIDELRRLLERGRLKIRFETEVARMERGSIALRAKTGSESLATDAVFVMIGSIPPWSFLEQIGVRRAVAVDSA
jgi:thioredoxin reductase